MRAAKGSDCGAPAGRAAEGEPGAVSGAVAAALRLVPLLPVHARIAAALQAGAMAAGTGDRSWTPDAIGSLLAMRGSFGYLAVEGDPPAPEPIGLVFCRSVTDEGEILVLAVLPGHWRRGLGRMLLAAALERAVTLGLRRILLEVAVDNEPARALYEAAGFRRVGRRRDYYRRADGRLVDALTLEVRLPP